MSYSFSRDFRISLGSFDRLPEVAIFDDRIISALDVYRDCVLEMFGVGLLISLIPI